MSLVQEPKREGVQHRAPQARAVEKQRAILDAAIEIMFTAGLPKVTHRQVATRAGVPVGSIGYYFHTRDELLVRAVEEINRRRGQLAQSLIDDLRANAGADTDSEALARILVEIYLPKGRDVLVGWVGLALDCVRESETLRAALVDYRASVHSDLTECLAAAGRSEVGADVILLILDGAIMESAVCCPEGGAADEVAAQRLTGFLNS